MSLNVSGHLLLCERCGVHVEAPRRPDMGDFSFHGPITHDVCGEEATLVAVSHGLGTHGGGRIRVFSHDLPERGRR